MKPPRTAAPAPRRAPAVSATRDSAAAPVVLGLVAFLVYAALCPLVSGPGDASEFTLVLATNGVAHPTGYPLYTLIGHAFVSLLHASGVAWPHAANLWSAVGGAVATGFLFAFARALTRRVPGVGPSGRVLAATIPVLLFAFQPILLGEATVAEINSWTCGWVAAAGWLFVRLEDALEGHGVGLRGAILWGLVVGAGLAHELTSVLVALPLSIALVITAGRRGRPLLALILTAALAACVPLASYGIIAWRAWHPALVQWPALAPGFASVRDHVTGEQYRHYIGYFAPAPDQRALIDHFVWPFLGAGFIALLAGLVRARDAAARITWAALTVSAALVTAFTLRYGVADPAPYFLPAMALGAAAIAPALGALSARLRGLAVPALGVAALAAGLVATPWVEGGTARLGEIKARERLLRRMWAVIPPDSSIVIWPDDRYIHLREYQLLSGEKPALTVLCLDLLLDERTRAGLARRFGVDPIAGHPAPHIAPGSPDADARTRQYFKEVVRSFNDRIDVRVIVFDPSVPIVQEQHKTRPAAGPKPPAPR